MSHYKPYPVYRASGVEWLGRVPEHWQVGAVKHWFSTTSGGTPDTSQQDAFYTDEGGFPWIRTTDLNNDYLRSYEVAITDAAIKNSACALLPVGSVLVAMYGGGGTIGKNALLSISACINQALCALLPAAGFVPEYTFRYIQFYKPHWMIDAESTRKDPNISQELVRGAPMIKPPIAEQLIISAHLDRETARIDALIEKKTHFIELLREKTLSLIGKAFECEESAWIRLQHVCDVVSRPVGHEENKSYVRLGLYNRGRGIFKKMETDAEDMGDSDFFRVESGDLILSGQFAWEGAVALADAEHEACVVSHRYPVIRGRNGEVLTEYLFAFFLSHYGDFLLNDCSRGAAGRNRPLNLASLLKWKVPVPSMELQEEVATLVRFRRLLLLKVDTSITLLKERRSALIAAAVTGQIDLREAV